MSLPKIPGVISFSKELPYQQPLLEVPEEEDERELAFNGNEEGNDKFKVSLQKLGAVGYPKIDPTDSVKHRIDILEETVDTQQTTNRITNETFSNLSDNLLSTEDRLKIFICEVQRNFDEKLAAMKKEYDHRFELQSIENKRFQSHISSLKSDTKLLRNKLHVTMDKLKRLQREFGDPDLEFEDELNFLVTANFSVSGSVTSLSRPHTTGDLPATR